MHKLINYNQGVFSNIIHEYEWGHNYNTRRISGFRHPFSRVTANQQFCLTKGMILWDNMPNDIKSEMRIGYFKRGAVDWIRSTEINM